MIHMRFGMISDFHYTSVATRVHANNIAISVENLKILIILSFIFIFNFVYCALCLFVGK